MFKDKRFTAMQQRFREVSKLYPKMIEDRRSEAAKTVVSKGRLYNVLPYEAQLQGDKLNGKILPEPIIHTDCYIYRFDEQGRVVLTENMSEFLERPAFFSHYSYYEDYIERIYGESEEPYRVDWAYMKNGIVKEKLVWSDEEQEMEIYIYDQEVLTDIQLFGKTYPASNFKLLYDAKSVLACIHRTWEDGQRKMVYTTETINFKKFSHKFLLGLENAVIVFLEEHKNEKFTRFAMDCYSGHNYVSLSMDTSADEEYKDSPVDWLYYDFASLPLIDFPLDDRQEDKLIKAVVQAARALKRSEGFASLT
ncbi:MAG: hypothetical protein FWG14_08215, partial [Peptococcaceae bacterium]|nr:hypothetical protein [Peptococcaceae bacterium]